MNPKFLVVDDDPSCTDLLSTILTSLGCDSDSLNSGTEALEVLCSEERVSQYDAVFLDIMMPDIDGLSVLKKLRELPHGDEVPVIMLTALDRSEQVLQGYLNGATYYITKPFSQEQVVYGLDLLLGEEEREGAEPRVYELED